MIYGNGDIASTLEVKEGITFFAAGVSNSKCTDREQFKRERDTLNKVYKLNKNNRLVYFSTLSIYDNNTAYAMHKIYQEEYIRHKINKYCIIRLGNITWGKNPNTIINTFKKQIANGQESEIQDRYKCLCTKDEFKYWLNLIPDFNTEMNITGERVTVQEIYNRVKGGTL